MNSLRFAGPVALFVALWAIVSVAEPPKPPAWGDKDKKAATALIEKYIKAKKEDRPAVLKEVAAMNIPVEQIPKMATVAFQSIMALGQKSEGKGDNHPVLDEALFTDDMYKKDHKGIYLLQNQGNGKGPKPAPLFIGLHGGGKNSADPSGAAGQWGSAGSKGAVCVFPRVLEPLTEGEWNKENEQQWLITLIEEIKHSFNIDTNHIYCAGHSMGGYGTWGMGGFLSDTFAAVGACAGGATARMEQGRVQYVQAGQLENFLNLPIYFYHGTDDPQVPPGPDRYSDAKFTEWKYEHVFKEYPGIGHGYPPGGLGPIIEYMFTKTRNPIPKRVVFYPTLKWHLQSYWIGISEWVGDPNDPCHIDASRDGNTIEIKTERYAPKLLVMLNDKMVDFSKPVVVKVNGTEKFNAVVTPNFCDALETIVDRNDNNMWFPVILKIE